MKMMQQVTSALVIYLLCLGPACASDREELATLLHEFLAAADKQAAHETFWAEDLVYTSSDGSRFDKATIMAGFDDAESSEEPFNESPEMRYAGEDVDIRLYGDTAIVAFKLVGRPTDESSAADVINYFNTGTFLKRDGVWQVIAWQATKIPPP